MITKVLCVCKGNGDRSPLMAAVLRYYLNNAGKTGVICRSAGILDVASGGGPASDFMVKAAKRIGISLFNHKRLWIDSIDPSELDEYDLFICVDEEVATYVIEQIGVDIKKIYNAQVSCSWPSQFQRDYDDTAERIMAAMYRVVTRFFSSE